MKQDRADIRSRPLNRVALQRRVDALFRAVASDFLLREQFITDPAQITAEYVIGRRLPEEEAESYNYFIHTTAASQRMIVWLRKYAASSEECRPLSAKRFLDDFSRAVVETRSTELVRGFAYFSTRSRVGLRLSDAWINVIFSPWNRIGETDTDETGTDETGTDTTGTDETGTDTTGTDTTGTDATGTDQTGTDATGTDQTGTDGTGTDGTSTDGTGTDSTGTDITGTDGTGTDATDGGTGATMTAITWSTFTPPPPQTVDSTTIFTHTAMTRSPITTFTTDARPNDLFFGLSHVIVALDALTAYSRQLQRAGELMPGWVE